LNKLYSYFYQDQFDAPLLPVIVRAMWGCATCSQDNHGALRSLTFASFHGGVRVLLSEAIKGKHPGRFSMDTEHIYNQTQDVIHALASHVTAAIPLPSLLSDVWSSELPELLAFFRAELIHEPAAHASASVSSSSSTTTKPHETF